MAYVAFGNRLATFDCIAAWFECHGNAVQVVIEQVRITGAVYLPWRPGDPVSSQDLRTLPTARIEAAINERLFAMKRTVTITNGKIALPSGRKISERDLLKPLGNPKRTPDFYELVALQYGKLAAQGDLGDQCGDACCIFACAASRCQSGQPAGQSARNA